MIDKFSYLQNQFYIESKLKTDLNTELRKLFVVYVADKHISTLLRKCFLCELCLCVCVCVCMIAACVCVCVRGVCVNDSGVCMSVYVFIMYCVDTIIYF